MNRELFIKLPCMNEFNLRLSSCSQCTTALIHSKDTSNTARPNPVRFLIFYFFLSSAHFQYVNVVEGRIIMKF